MKEKRKLAKFVSACLLLSSFSCLAGCSGGGEGGKSESGASSIDRSKYAFVFTGKGNANSGRELNFTITGNKDSENSFSVTVKELKALELTGTWKFVEKKGYKLYFNDASNTLKYTNYDATSKEFSFNASIDVGSYGTPKVSFTFKDDTFDYDGVGLGKEPPVFNTVGWVGGVIEVQGNLTCTEEGTFSTYDTWHHSRVGSWSYDDKANSYTLTPTDDPFYEAYVGKVEDGSWTSFTYKPWHTTEVPAQSLTKEDLDAVNWFRDPIVCKYDSEAKAYTGEIQLIWGGASEQFCEITRFTLTFSD